MNNMLNSKECILPLFLSFSDFSAHQREGDSRFLDAYWTGPVQVGQSGSIVISGTLHGDYF